MNIYSPAFVRAARKIEDKSRLERAIYRVNNQLLMGNFAIRSCDIFEGLGWYDPKIRDLIVDQMKEAGWQATWIDDGHGSTYLRIKENDT